jgi:hypothetical protein
MRVVCTVLYLESHLSQPQWAERGAWSEFISAPELTMPRYRFVNTEGCEPGRCELSLLAV